MLDKIKNHVTSDGHTVGEYLQEKYPEGKWSNSDKEVSYDAIVLGKPVRYRWDVVNGEIDAISGKAAKLTPKLHKISRELEEKRSEIPAEQLEIFDYVRERFGEHGDEEGSIKDAAEKFSKTEKEIEEIYFDVDEKLR
jgi:hypothetical protein